MLNGEALAYGKKLREDLGKQDSLAVIAIDAEQFRQFLDVALWEIEKTLEPTEEY